MTVWVAVERGVIAETAPVVRMFVGQPLANLERWMRRQGGFEKSKLL